MAELAHYRASMLIFKFKFLFYLSLLTVPYNLSMVLILHIIPNAYQRLKLPPRLLVVFLLEHAFEMLCAYYIMFIIILLKWTPDQFEIRIVPRLVHLIKLFL